MASISVGGGNHGKRAVDHEIPLIPFIDLLLCCVMFLLVTAVWNRLAQVDTPLASPGDPSAIPAALERPTLYLRLTADGFEVGSSLGDATHVGRDPGLTDLRGVLAEQRAHQPADVEVAVTTDDGVEYGRVIEAVDTLSGAGFARFSVHERD